MSCLICVCQLSTIWDLLGSGLILLIPLQGEKNLCPVSTGAATSSDFHHSFKSVLSAHTFF